MAQKADQKAEPVRRTPLNRERVLRAAVELADRSGIEALSMRSLAHELDVVPMALYKHVANKEELLDGMVDVIAGEIEPAAGGADWKSAIRRRILSARQTLLRHPWASRVIETRAHPTPGVLDYVDSVIGMFRSGGLSADLTHHAMHALGSRVWGFTQELFPAPPPALAAAGGQPESALTSPAQMAARYPHIVEIVLSRPHDGDSVVGPGCDDQFEFEFALDLMLDGFERLHRRGWTSGHGGGRVGP